jgi:hypothetical protein
MWLNDEAYFHLNGYMNKQKRYVWASVHSHDIMQTPLHTEKHTAWCALPNWGIVGPIFFYHTVTADHYLHVHQDEFLPSLVNFGETFFNQDGAWAYTVNVVLDVLNEHSGDSVLSTHFPEWSRCGRFWPSYSPHFNPCDYFLMGLPQRYSLQKQSTHNTRIETRNSVSSDQHQ